MEILIKKAISKKRRHRSGRRRSLYWIISAGTFGAIIAFTVGSSRAMNVAYAVHRNGELVVTKNAGKVFKADDFNIPPGTLQEVIAAFEKKTGITVSIENESILQIASPGAVGSLTAEQALRQILNGTGVSYAFKGARSVLLNLQAEAANVEIIDSEAKVISSPKYLGSLREIPQTISVINKDVIEQQGATTLRDVLNNVPGITITAGEGGAPAGDNLTIRGFSARNDIYIDGVRDLGGQSRDPFNLEQVEVVKGPSSTFTGRGSTGGTVNLVSKLPNLRRTISGTLTGGTDATKRATADVNLPVTDSIAFRLNLLGHDSNFAGREVVKNNRYGAAPSVIFGLGKPTRYSFSYFFIDQESTSDYGIPWVPEANTALIDFRGRPAPVPRSNFYGFLDRDKEKVRADQFTARIEHEFSDNLIIRNQFRYGYSRRDSLASPPRFASNSSTIINRELRSFLTNDDIFDNQTDVTAEFSTGSIEHATVFGGSYTVEKNHRVLRTAAITVAANNLQTTLFNPNTSIPFTGVIFTNPLEPDLTAKTFAAYLFDTVKLGKYFSFTGGLRFDRFDVEGRNVVTAGGVSSFTPIARVDDLFSGRASLIFKPLQNGNIYASFGTSANPSLEGLLINPADVRTDPEKTRTFEIGSKWDFFGTKLLLTGAVFQVEKTNARTPSIVPGEAPSLDGDQLVQGIEISATGNITRSWQIFAGYTFLDSEIVRSNTPPTIINNVSISQVGKEIINTPRNSFNLWTTYTLDKLFIGGGPRFIDARFGNSINTRSVDSYVVVDALVSYKLTKNIDLRLNLNNVGDKFYFDRISGGHIVPGAGRSLLFSSGFSF